MPSRPPVGIPAPARRSAHREFPKSFDTRKRLTGSELLSAGGVGLGIGLVCFYFAKVWFERTPVLPPSGEVVMKSDDASGAVNRTVTPRRAAT